MAASSGDETRTRLAAERTMLAWWRTGLAALAVALAVGRLLPEFDTDSQSWPYVVIGLGFAFYGIGLFVFGTLRGAQASIDTSPGAASLAIAGILLGLVTAALIAAG